MNFTAYHAKYFAHELTKRSASDSLEKLASALVDAQVDLNPHPKMAPFERGDLKANNAASTFSISSSKKMELSEV